MAGDHPQSDRERKSVERFKATPKYKAALKKAAGARRRYEAPVEVVKRRAAGKGEKIHDVKAGPEGKVVYRKARKFLPDEAHVVAVKNGQVKKLPAKAELKYRIKHDKVTSNGAQEGGLKVLEEISKPRYAIGGVAKHGLSVKSIKRGVKERINPGRVVADKLGLGDKKGDSKLSKLAGTALAFTVDVGADPLTYTGAGLVGKAARTAKVESKAMRAAGKSEAAEKAAAMKAAGKSKEEIAHVTKGIEKRAAVKARAHEIDRGGHRGPALKFAGKPVPGMAKVTAAVGEGARHATGRAAHAPGVRRLAPKARAGKAQLRNKVAAVRPQIRTAEDVAGGTTRGQHFAGRVSAAERRGSDARAVHEADLLMEGLNKKITAPEWEIVVAARETGATATLPAHLQEAAAALNTKIAGLTQARDLAHIKEGRIGAHAKPPVAATAKEAYKTGARSKRTAAGSRRASAEVRAAEKAVAQATARLGVARGRAEVGSRNVGGRKAEGAAGAAGKVRQPAFAAGGHGVSLAEKALDTARAKLAAAEDRAGTRAAYHTAAKAGAKEARMTAYATKKEGLRRQGEAVAYYPHVPHEKLTDRMGITDPRTPVEKTVFPSSKTVSGSERREHVRPIHEQPEMGFSRDTPLVMHAYASDTGRRAAASEFYQDLANLGRPAASPAELAPGEALYRLGHEGKRYGLHEVKAGEAVKAGDHAVALPRAFVDRTTASSHSTWDNGVWDAATNSWKTLATATPGFHIRNMFGDTWMWHTMRDGGIRKAPSEIRAAWKGVAALGKAEGALRKGDAVNINTIPYGQAEVRIAGRPMDVSDFVNLANDHGILRSGHIGGELKDALRMISESGARGKIARVTSPLRRWGQNREDLMRLASFKNGLDNGMHPALAAQKARDTHFDYRELTNFERQLKRHSAPFYTFSGRSIPQQAMALATRPGKFSNLEAAREEIADAFGMTPEEMDAGLTELQEKMIPFRVKIAGDRAVSFDLPAQALGALPTGLNKDDLGHALTYWLDTATGLLHPAPKTAIEQTTNTNLMFREQTKETVPAPSWAGKLPAFMKTAMGVVPEYDQPDGKVIGWRWAGRQAQLASAALPGGPGAAIRASTPKTGEASRAQGVAEALVSPALGFRAAKVDPSKVAIGEVAEKRKKLEARKKALEQQGLFRSPQWRLIDREIKILKRAQSRAFKEAEPAPQAPAGFWDDDAPAADPAPTTVPAPAGDFWDD